MTGTIAMNGLTEDPTRRQVSVLFCDLVGSTELSGQLDPEDYQEILDQYRQCVSAVIVAHDGHLHHTPRIGRRRNVRLRSRRLFVSDRPRVRY